MIGIADKTMASTDFRERLWDAWLTLQRECVRRGLDRPTQQWLSQRMKELGEPRGQGGISDWFRGNTTPSDVRTYVILAQALSWGERGEQGWVDPGWLCFGEETNALPPEFHGGARWEAMPRNGDDLGKE